MGHGTVWLSPSPWIPQVLSRLSGPASPHSRLCGLFSNHDAFSVEPKLPGDLEGVCTGPPGTPHGFIPATGHAGAGTSGRGSRVRRSRRLVLAAPPRDAELHQQHSDRTRVSASPQNPLPEAPVPQHPGPASLIYRNVRRNTHTILPPSSSSESPGHSAGSACLCTLAVVLPPSSGARPHSAALVPRSHRPWRRLHWGRGASFSASPLRSGRLPHVPDTLVLAGLGPQKVLCLTHLPGS